MQDTQALGTFKRRDDHIDVRFERHYPRPVETVWSALTDPARLADWMGVSEVEPRVGGRFHMMADGPHPMTGRVLVWEPPQVLELTWSNADAPESIVRYELTPEPNGTRLIFTHRGIPYGSSALMLPGWHNYFARLSSLLGGNAVPWSNTSWRELQATYVDHYKLNDVKLDI
jgi:uncharacterized protein YndB with AHSA1/START domain